MNRYNIFVKYQRMTQVLIELLRIISIVIDSCDSHIDMYMVCN